MNDENEIVPGWNAPDAEAVYRAAQAESSRKPLQDYMGAIVELRESKGFSFREIADWLNEKVGIKADHNMVYREYHKYTKKECKRLGVPPYGNPNEENETAED
jgi:ribosome-binding protein aMBF1 (putative translation factor)